MKKGDTKQAGIAPHITNKDLNEERLKMEVEKLSLEIKEAKSPFYRSLKFILPVFTAILLAGVTIVQTVIVNRLNTTEGAIKVLKMQIGRHGFNPSTLWAIWHILDERQKLGDSTALALLGGIKSFDYTVSLNYPRKSPYYSIGCYYIGNSQEYKLDTSEWSILMKGGQEYIWRSQALRYILHLKGSLETLNEIFDKNKPNLVWSNGKKIDNNDMIIFSQHRNDLQKTLKEYTRLIGKNQNFIDAGNYAIEKMFDSQLDN